MLTGLNSPRLSELDLSHNQLTSVQNIGFLPSLSSLDLQSNQLDKFKCSRKLPKLRSLKLSDNQISALNISRFPSLNLLHLDRNKCPLIEGLSRCGNLEVLSIREQNLEDEDFYDCVELDLGLAQSLRRLYLSCNTLYSGTLIPSLPLPSLELLDIASCKRDWVPGNFAESFPNLKVLNLNYNCLEDIDFLQGLKRLTRLQAAGNRLTRMRKTCQLLGQIGRRYIGKTTKQTACTLREVDLRDNPMTLRFFPPAVTGNGSAKSTTRHAKAKSHSNVALAAFGPPAHTSHSADGVERVSWDDLKTPEIQVNDPFTLPPVDAEADAKYRSRLDDQTCLRRNVLQVFLFMASSGSIKTLDGIKIRLEDLPSSNDTVWIKLERLGVVKRKEKEEPYEPALPPKTPKTPRPKIALPFC